MKLLVPIFLLLCLTDCPGDEKKPAAKDLRSLAEKQKAYPALVAAIEDARNNFAKRWAAADDNQHVAILQEARSFLEKSIIQDLFPCWIGTPWDFNGVSQKPGQGSIACGYFVSTLLRDAGFRIERANLGQQASQIIISTMTPRDQI